MQFDTVFLVLPGLSLDESAGSLTSFALRADLGSKLEALVLPDQGDARYKGLDQVTVLESQALGPANPDGAAQAVADYIKEQSDALVLFDDTRFSQQIAVRLAAIMGVPAVTHVIDLSKKASILTVHKKVYSGSLIQGYRCNVPAVFTVDLTAVPPAERDEAIPVIHKEATVDDNDAQFTLSDQNQGPDLSTARLVVAGGRGLQDKDGAALVNSLAEQLNGAVGASRAAVDAGWFATSTMVGQSGKTVAPELYLAAGISGTIQHTVGMDKSKCVVAINTDAEAPIFDLADYGLVADARQALTELIEKTAAPGSAEESN